MIKIIIIIIIILILLSFEHFNPIDNINGLFKNDFLFKKLTTNELNVITNDENTETESIVDYLYPIGSIFMCDVENPVDLENIYPGTKWKIIEDPGFIMNRITDPKNCYITGGSNSVSVFIIPDHSHNVKYHSQGKNFGSNLNDKYRDNVVDINTALCETTNTGGSKNFIPRYINILIYERIE